MITLTACFLQFPASSLSIKLTPKSLPSGQSLLWCSPLKRNATWLSPSVIQKHSYYLINDSSPVHVQHLSFSHHFQFSNVHIFVSPISIFHAVTAFVFLEKLGLMLFWVQENEGQSSRLRGHTVAEMKPITQDGCRSLQAGWGDVLSGFGGELSLHEKVQMDAKF